MNCKPFYSPWDFSLFILVSLYIPPDFAPPLHSVFEAAATDLDELTDTLTLYIGFCENRFVTTKTFWAYNKNKH